MAKKTAYLGLFCAAALILSYVESLIPFFAGIPGMKLGLPNAAIVSVLYLYSWKEAALVNLARILAAGFLFGNAFGILYSAAGAGLSLLCMQLVKRTGKFSPAGVSVIGGVAHNAGQVIALRRQSKSRILFRHVLRLFRLLFLIESNITEF